MTFIPIKDGVISTNNSTATPLGSGVTFTGTADDTKGYSTYNLFLKCSHAGHIIVYQGADGTNWDIKKRYNFDPTKEKYLVKTVRLSARYVYVTVTNTGGALQTELRFSTSYHTNKTATDSKQSVTLEEQNLDTFQRLITCEPHTDVDVNRILGVNDIELINYTVGAGTITHNSNHASVDLTVTNAGDIACSRTRARIIYQPSKVIDCIFTGVLSISTGTNANAKMGLYDEYSGVYLLHSNGVNAIVHRSTVSGNMTENVVFQTDWNGSFNFNFDATKANIFNIRHAWLGVSSVRVGIYAHGHLHTLHTFYFENILATPFQTMGTLPITWEVEAVGAPSTSVTCRAICGSISSLAGANPTGRAYAVSRGITPISVSNTEAPLLAVRLSATNWRLEAVQVLLKHITVLCTTTGNILIRVRKYNDTADTVALTTPAPTWTAVGLESGIQYSINSTVLGGSSTIISQGYFSSSQDSINIPSDSSSRIAYNQKNSLSDIVVITAQSMTAQNETLFCSADLVSYI